MSHAHHRPNARLFAAILSHAVVDFLSFVVVPLLSVIEGRVNLAPWQGILLVAIGSVASGIIQPIVALLSDRHDTRWLGTLGLVALVLAIGSIGYAESFGVLLVLQIIASAGGGAFHPVAAAAVGHLAGHRRAGGLAWFYAAGMIGGVLGNLGNPAWVRHFSLAHSGSVDAAAGLRSLVWYIPAGLLFAVVLALAIHSVPHRHGDAHAEHRLLSREERIERWRSVWLLYFGNVLRFTVDMCLITLIVRWSELIVINLPQVWTVGADVGSMLTPELRSEASRINGLLQAARQVGMGAGGLAILLVLRGRGERALLIAVPVLGAVVIALTPFAAHVGLWLVVILCMLAGLGYGGVIPITLSMAQRLLPHCTSLASALMLGGAWMFASAGPHLAQALFSHVGLTGAMLVVAILLAASAALAMMIRSISAQVSPTVETAAK